MAVLPTDNELVFLISKKFFSTDRIDKIPKTGYATSNYNGVILMREVSLLIFYGGQSGPQDLTPAEYTAMTKLGQAIKGRGDTILHVATGAQRAAMLSGSIVQETIGSRIRPQQSVCLDDLTSTCQGIYQDERADLLYQCRDAYGSISPRHMAGILQAQSPRLRRCFQDHFKRGAGALMEILFPLVTDSRNFPNDPIIGLAIAHRLSFIEGALRHLGRQHTDYLLYNLAEDTLLEDEGHQAIFLVDGQYVELDRVERIVLPALAA